MVIRSSAAKGMKECASSHQEVTIIVVLLVLDQLQKHKNGSQCGAMLEAYTKYSTLVGATDPIVKGPATSFR